jgi:hypothetical protein
MFYRLTGWRPIKIDGSEEKESPQIDAPGMYQDMRVLVRECNAGLGSQGIDFEEHY